MTNHTPGLHPGEPGTGRARRRTLFRVLGLVSMGVAIALIAIAVHDFFTFDQGVSSPGTAFPFDAVEQPGAEEPTKFWMFFLAMPFFLVGGIFLTLGFAGAQASYLAGEYSPAIRSVSRDLGVRPDGPGAGPYCRSCGTQNDLDATFCDRCGTSMGS